MQSTISIVHASAGIHTQPQQGTSNCVTESGQPSVSARSSGNDAVEWRYVCAVEEIPVLGARVIERSDEGGGNVAVFRNDKNAVFALLDKCPHKGGPLSQGIVFGERVACPLHNWTIELKSGEAVAPDVGCTKRFPVKVEAGDVFVQL